jgi:N-acetylglucosamine-6-phosphate deacetylase
VHLEGPWLNPEQAGGQRVQFLRPPDLAELEALVGLAPVRWATVAPELPGADVLVRRMKGLGLVVAAGHTAASYAQMQRAVEWGVDHCTHFFNAMSGFHHREPGVVGAGLLLPGLSLELIADGIHVHPAALRLAYETRGQQRLVLVTDAVECAGEAEGIHGVDGRTLVVRDGSIRLAGGTLAGSALTMNRAVALMVQQVGVPLAEALAMATLVPARRLGLAGRKGTLAPGKDADLVVLDGQFQVRLTAVRGRVVYERPG